MNNRIELPAASPWGWSEVVSMVDNVQDAAAIVSLFSAMRELIGNPPSWWQSLGAPPIKPTP